MKVYGVDVTYKAFVTERTVVKANDKEEAKQKILDGDIEDVLDSFIETEEVDMFDFFQEDDVDE